MRPLPVVPKVECPKETQEVIQKLNFPFFDANTKQYTRRQLVAFHSSSKGTALHLITQKKPAAAPRVARSGIAEQAAGAGASDELELERSTKFYL